MMMDDSVCLRMLVSLLSNYLGVPESHIWMILQSSNAEGQFRALLKARSISPNDVVERVQVVRNDIG